MIQNTLQVIHSVKEALQSNLPQKLSVLGVSDFDEYLTEPPYNVDASALAVYMGTGNDSKSVQSETVIVQAQLPGVFDPVLTHTAIWETLQEFKAEQIGYIDKELTFSGYYPGDVGDGGGGSFLIYEVDFSLEVDDCEL